MKITVLRSHATPQIEMWQDENSCGAAGSLDTSVFVRHILHGSGRQATVSIYCSSFLYITHSYVPRYQSNTPPICDHIDSSSKVLKSAPISAFYRGGLHCCPPASLSLEIDSENMAYKRIFLFFSSTTRVIWIVILMVDATKHRPAGYMSIKLRYASVTL